MGQGAAHHYQTTQDKANCSNLSLVVIITIKGKIIFLYLISPSTLGTQIYELQQSESQAVVDGHKYLLLVIFICF